MSCQGLGVPVALRSLSLGTSCGQGTYFPHQLGVDEETGAQGSQQLCSRSPAQEAAEPTLKPSTAPPIRRWRALYYCRTALLPSLPFLQRSWGVLLPWALLPPQLADQSLPVPGTHSCSCRSVFIPQPGLPPKHK